MSSARGSDWIRARRAALVDDHTLRGRAFGAALSAAVDTVLAAMLETVGDQRVAVLAMGSYARRELAPGSDLDILLVHDRRPDVAAVADALWYPLWDAGFVIGHATRTAKESLKLSGEDVDTLTALLDARVVGGGRADAGSRLIADARALARRQRSKLVEALADASMLRRVRPGPVAEMLEPNLKVGAGGLRDLQALTWAGYAIGGDDGRRALVDEGALRSDDPAFLDAAAATLVDVRLALHRVTGGRSDVLALQDQDAVAVALEFVDADAMVRDLAATARRVAWIVDDAWSRIRPEASRRVRAHLVTAPLPAGIVEREGRVAVEPDAPIDDGVVLRVARAAAERGWAVDRGSLARLRAAPAMVWGPEAVGDFLGLLRQGVRAIDVFEALDHENLVVRILPEWEHVRFRPQRNAYHRFTVDRHLLETVAEAAALLDDPSAPDARAAQLVRAPDLLLLGALLHDIGKGRPGDHSAVGAHAARSIGERLALPVEQIEILVWLVREHLLMADTATRRDLSDATTIRRFSARVGDTERLGLLTLLTVADSRATGPSAWGSGKAALVRELYDLTYRALTTPDPDAFDVDPVEVPEAALLGPGVVVEWEPLDDRRLRCTVGASDRPGLLAGVAGALALEGFDISSADGRTLADGRAAEVFVGRDRFDRLADDEGRDRCAATIEGVLAGRISVVEGLRARRATYGRPAAASDETVRVRVAQDESDDATVVEVYAPDEIGLLATIAAVFTEVAVDVRVARVATTGEQAVDVFYVHEHGEKVTDPARVHSLREALFTALRRD